MGEEYNNESKRMPATKTFMEDKLMMIIGGGNQLGLDLAKAAAELGAQIVLAGLEEEILKHAAKKLVATGYKALFSTLNPTKPDEVKSIFATVKERFGKLDILVLNLEFANFNPIEKVGWIEWQNILMLNLTAPFLCLQQGFKLMQENSIIIGINSSLSRLKTPKSAAFASAKAGMHQLLAVAREEAKIRKIEILEAFIDEETLPRDNKDKMKKFYRDAARQIVIACNPLSSAHQLEFYLGYSE